MKRIPASFYTNNSEMNKGYDWALNRAAGYIVTDEPIGPCYEAALPGRRSFCMRDSAHQALGAHVLNADDCNKNIFNQFGAAINESRDFCSYWEIKFDGAPCEVDYTNDNDFWYNLPANFDIMDACYRMFNWTSDESLLFSDEMEYFHQASTHDYIRVWDRDGDGIIDRNPTDNRRGIAGYDESVRNRGYRVAADLLAAQYAGLSTRAKMLDLKGEKDEARVMKKRADDISDIYSRKWWDDKNRHFANVYFPNGVYGGEYVGMTAFMPLYFGIIADKTKLEAQLAYIIKNDSSHIQEERSYIPEILWRYGADEAALSIWLKTVAPDYERRDYPEISFAALGAIASGYMGISPDARTGTVFTRSAVISGFAEMNNLPLWGGHINVRHEQKNLSILENQTGRDLTWICRFDGANSQTVHVAAGNTMKLSR